MAIILHLAQSLPLHVSNVILKIVLLALQEEVPPVANVSLVMALSEDPVLNVLMTTVTLVQANLQQVAPLAKLDILFMMVVYVQLLMQHLLSESRQKSDLR
jgi:hypothetical protein